MLIWHPSLITFRPSWHKVDRVANYLSSIFQKPQHIGHLDFVTLVTGQVHLPVLHTNRPHRDHLLDLFPPPLHLLSCKVTRYLWPFLDLICCQYFAFVPSTSFLPAQVNAKLSKAKRKKCPSIHFTVKRFSVIYPMDTIHPGRCTWVEATMQAIIRLWISSPPLINEIAQFHRQKFPFSILAMFNFLRKKRNRFI